MITLLSPASIGSYLASQELDSALARRDIDVVPALLEPCPLPAPLTRRFVDVRAGIDELLERLRTNAEIDLAGVSPQQFERLVGDLLTRLNFQELESLQTDEEVDFQGVYQDELGLGDPTPYVIQCKVYKQKRPSVEALRRLRTIAAAKGPRCHGLMVTNSQLTSVAFAALHEINRANSAQVRVLDGPAIKRLLPSHPDLVEAYFSGRDKDPDDVVE